MTMEQMQEAAQFVQGRLPGTPKIGMILGSGLGVLADELEHSAAVPYESIPHFPVSTVPGHAGRLVFGYLAGVPVLVMQGRFHYYEGYAMQQVVFPVRVMRLLGITDLVVTNAAGGICREFSPGDLMLITDHIKFFDENPLRGPNIDAFGSRFFDLSAAYNPDLRAAAAKAADKLGVTLREGIYAYMPGPNFETPAEIRMLRTLGADAVGMSTVPEVITAVHSGMRVLGISCITNMAAGMLPQPLSHEEVMETGRQVRSVFASLLRTIVGSWNADR